MEREIISRVATQAGIDPNSVTLDTSLDSIGLDSLDIADLFLYVEKEFKVRIPDKFFSTARTVGDVVNASRVPKW